VPVLAAMGLPAYGHSSRALPPKFGITFEEMLAGPYAGTQGASGARRVACLRQHGFGYLSTAHTHPKLERLRGLREAIVKRPMLAAVEKMLMPVSARPGGNFLATGYFHKGYEIPMLAIARESQFDRVSLGNGQEGTTLYGVHKTARVFLYRRGEAERDVRLDKETMLDGETAERVAAAYEELKNTGASPAALAFLGEAALKGTPGPAAWLIACQAGTLLSLFGLVGDPQAGFDRATEVLSRGGCYDALMRYLEGLG